MKNKKNERTKNKKGITLVALVVTIVVLIILAGISINLAVGDNGVISKAKQAKEMQEMSDVHDKLELIRGKVAIDNETIVTWDKYKDELIKENIITGDDDVEDIENGKKQIVTDTGYVAVIEILSDGTVGKIEIIGKKDSLKVNIINVAMTSETNSIKVDVTANRTENATFKYYYKIEGGEYQASPVHEGTDLSYTIANLAQNTTYTIKVQATNKNGTVEEEGLARTGEVTPAQGAITFDNLTWTSGKASVIVNKTISNNLQIQYKVNTGSYEIITSGATVNNMNVGDVLTVRLYDGTNYGSSASLTIADTTVPNSATISLSSTSVTAGTSLTATVTQTDSESGVNITSCKWVFNTKSSNIGTTESSYTGGTFNATTQTITLPISTSGIYYLHVLTMDNAENKKETISGAVTIQTLTMSDVSTIADAKNKNATPIADNKALTDDNSNTITVPAGFKIASDSPTKQEDGIVVEDKDGNQYVWIPVANIANYVRTDFGSSFDWQGYENFSETMPSDEQTSVSKYKGYYIGRYEAGDSVSTASKTLRKSGGSTNKVAIKKGQAPYNFITRSEAKTLATGIKAAEGYTTATTKLCSSYAWDTALNFLQSKVSNYGTSSNQGNYNDTTFSYTDITGATQTKAISSSVLIPTGQTIPVCSIYDMGGNDWELTTEACGVWEDTTDIRGGSYDRSFSAYPTGYRYDFSTIGSCIDITFRPTLYM